MDAKTPDQLSQDEPGVAGVAGITEYAPIGAVDDGLGRLRRWEVFGGHWRIRSQTPTQLEIALLTCSGGEDVDRMLTTDPAVLAYVGSRISDQDN